MVRVPDSGSSGLGSRPGLGHWFWFSSKVIRGIFVKKNILHDTINH